MVHNFLSVNNLRVRLRVLQDFRKMMGLHLNLSVKRMGEPWNRVFKRNHYTCHRSVMLKAYSVCTRARWKRVYSRHLGDDLYLRLSLIDA